MPIGPVSEHLRQGSLLQILPDELELRSAVMVVYPEREFLDVKVRAFVDHCVAAAEVMYARLVQWHEAL